ncbi:beta-N-acetylhexosaminidase [Swingsia samuiensis]|uniref:N-acetyl-beta-glucosaminidase n=1 Tax=Swingsia samuiensis TaxID=1293412 RepID=A0A4Y6UGC7_9PROT|nr:family 20 glycosylhydrolase [Swingsia samuiensis]QDH16609.1 beta-N-acetylhexosaminidase [Swingsia samuiensis]
MFLLNKRYSYSAKVILLCASFFSSRALATPILLPLPQSIEDHHEESASFGEVQVVWANHPSALMKRAEERFNDRVVQLFNGKSSSKKRYRLRVTYVNDPQYLTPQEKEHYSLKITGRDAYLKADGQAGVLRGMATFLQLMHVTDKSELTLDEVTIDDFPRFAWRGLLIDVSRHFLSVDTVKRQLDAMELMKFNVLHWHLSDGTGFRVESHVFPKLTSISSHGEYYTQEQVRDIVSYAADRGIRVVPEFDVPGHALAILEAYPDLAAQSVPDQQQQKNTNLNNPAMDPTNPQTLSFIRSLYAEMGALFPDRYFHSGGDEVLASQWTHNRHIKAFMQQHGYRDAPALQAAFTAQVQKILSEQGKVMMGWDEVSEAPIPKDVVVEGWRGSKWTGTATQAGHPVVVSSGYYLDLLNASPQYYSVDPYDTQANGLTPAEIEEVHPKQSALIQAFSQDPTAQPLTPEQEKLVMGAEGALWSELVFEKNLDTRLWPRAATLAERFWSAKNVRDTQYLEERLPFILDELERMGLNYKQSTQELENIVSQGRPMPLHVLTSITIPVQNYALNILNNTYDVLGSPSGVANPDSFVGTQFNENVARYMAGEKSLEPVIEHQLEVWSDNENNYALIAKGNSTLEAVLPTVHVIGTLARSALKELHHDLSDSERAKAIKLILKQEEYEHNSSNMLLAAKRKQPEGGLLIAILPGLKQLINDQRSVTEYH